MSKPYNTPKYRGRTKVTGSVIGIIISGLLFLAIPLTQIFNDFDKNPEQIETINVAPPPPPPPPEDPPEPPPPEEEEPPPELNTPPPPISLEQLDMALNPGTGGSMAGDFALPTLDLGSSDLGGLEIFDINDLEVKPEPRRQGAPQYPAAARRRGQEGFATAEFIIDQNGKVSSVKITASSDPIFERPTIEAIRKWRFIPGEQNGRPVKTRTRVRLPYTIK